MSARARILQLHKASGEKQTDDREVVQEAFGSDNPGGTNVCIDSDMQPS